MAEMLKFELVSPERELASMDAEAVTIPAMMGDLTAMVSHAPFLTNLRPGFVVARTGSSEETFFVTGGFAEISDDVVSILAEKAFEKTAIDRAFLEDTIEESEELLEEAIPTRRQAALQKLNDYKALLSQFSG